MVQLENMHQFSTVPLLRLICSESEVNKMVCYTVESGLYKCIRMLVFPQEGNVHL